MFHPEKPLCWHHSLPSLVSLTSFTSLHACRTAAAAAAAEAEASAPHVSTYCGGRPPLARGDSAYRCVAGSLFSPRCAGLLAQPLSSFWICQVSICLLLLPCSHTCFELLRKIYPSTLQGWIALDWQSGTNFRGAKKKNLPALSAETLLSALLWKWSHMKCSVYHYFN